ncbi:MAG: 30S ribosomal protein S6 [Candidatus Pacebacteria bacterium]|nr:30S ribosomal protein S6 [Candidatus Paceibacterota bacterium]
MQKEKYYYELTYLANPDLNETGLAELTEKVAGLCSKEQPILQSDLAKKIRLAYPIKKNKEAFLISLGLQAGPQTVIAIKKEMEEKKEVLRFLIVKKRIVPEEPKPAPIVELKKSEESEKEITEPIAEMPKTQAGEKKIKEAKKPKETAKKKASMEDIEKDLEKILGE